jgi:hypothetical protein
MSVTPTPTITAEAIGKNITTDLVYVFIIVVIVLAIIAVVLWLRK